MLHKMIPYFSVLGNNFLCRHVLWQSNQILYTTAILVEYLLKYVILLWPILNRTIKCSLTFHSELQVNTMHIDYHAVLRSIGTFIGPSNTWGRSSVFFQFSSSAFSDENSYTTNKIKLLDKK